MSLLIGLGIGAGILGFLGFVIFVIASNLYTIVKPSEAHLVVSKGKQIVYSPDDNVSTSENKSAYYFIPNWLPEIGMERRIMDVTIKELIVKQETIEKGQARYNVESSIKYRIKDVLTSAETYTNDSELKELLLEAVQSSVRAVTVKYDVEDARAKKLEIETEIKSVIDKDLKAWGLELVSFQLVNFEDTEESKIISDISKRREVEISAQTREQNAEKFKLARLKEAEAEEIAKQREIEKDQLIAEREQQKKEKVALKEKTAREKEYEVLRVEQVKQAEIDKERAKVIAEKERQVSEINKEKLRLDGEGEKLRLMEIAIGNAEDVRQKGFAEAEAKEKLQEALNKFGDEAIRALVAEKIVEKDKAIGIETAKALEHADLKVFSGGDQNGGFDLGKMISSLRVADSNTASMLGNHIARPQDLGFTALGMKKVDEDKKVSEDNVVDEKSTSNSQTSKKQK